MGPTQYVHSLTQLTGRRANEHRRVLLSGVEMNPATLYTVLAATPIALVLVLVLWAPLGQLALLAVPAVLGGAFYLVVVRSREGLRLRTWETMRDRRQAQVGRFFVCGAPVDLDKVVAPVIVASAVPVAVAPGSSSDDLYGGSTPTARAARRRVPDRSVSSASLFGRR